MKIDIVQVPYDSGHRGRRMGAGPLRIVEADLVESFTTAGHEVQIVPVELESEFPTEIASAFQLAHSIRACVATALESERLPIILSGNCVASAGAVAALGEPRVVWFDAHGDLNTPNSTRSGFLDGMALSILLGRCWSGLASEVGLTPVPEDRIHLVGARDLDAAEDEFLEASSIRRSPPESTPRSGSDQAGRPTYLHIDLDVLDPSVGTVNEYGAPGGLTLDALLAMVEEVAGHSHVGAVTLSAYDPSTDSSGAIARAASRIAVAVASSASRQVGSDSQVKGVRNRA